jgi:iron complex outermembrane recepter protein
MKNAIIYVFIAAMFTTTAAAQNILKGKITDAADNKPLAGANIAHGSTLTTADNDGLFSVDCKNGSSITISFVGYETQKKIIRDCNEAISVVMIKTSRSLDEIEISATSNQNKSILYQPASITKLTAAELKRGIGLFLDDAVNSNVPGVTMNRRTVSGGQQFNIRGYGNGTRGARGVSSNFDGQGYKVYLNGIPVTDAEGITTMDDIDFGSIGSVEVTKGPAGTLYGLAIAGAVNLKTVTPEAGKTSVGQEVMPGNYGLRRYTTTFKTAGEHSAVLLNYGNQKSDGFSIHNKSKKEFVNFAGSFKPTEKQTISTYAGYSNSYDERLGELTTEQYDNNDYSGNPEYIKRDAHSNVITFRAGVGHTYNFTKNIAAATSIFGTGFTSNVSSAGGWTDKNTINYGMRSTIDTRFNTAGGVTLSGITGIETQRQDAQVLGYSMKQNPSDTASTWKYGVNPYWIINTGTSNTATTSKTTSLFTEWTLALQHDISITAGIGVSNMKIILNDRFNTAVTTRPSLFKKNYAGMVSPHIAVNKVFNKYFSVYAAYSKGYKAPTSSYFYITTPGPTGIGKVNDDLKSETGNQFEAGAKGRLLNNKLTYEVAFFSTEFSNKMTTIPVANAAGTATLYSYVVNGGTQKHQGIEALIKFTALQNDNGFFKTIRPFVNFTSSNFKYGNNFVLRKGFAAGDTLNYSNKAVAGVAKITANAGADIVMKHGLYAAVSYNYKDKMPITSLNDLYAGSYNLLNAKIGIQQRLGKHFDADIYAGASNITNTKYYLMVFVNQLPDAYIPAPPKANFFGGVNLKYNL